MLSILNLEGYSAARCFIHILGAVQVPLIPMQYPSFLLLLLLQLLLLLRPRCLHLCFCCGGGGAAGQLHPSVFDPEKCISFICFDKVYLIHKIVFGVFAVFALSKCCGGVETGQLHPSVGGESLKANDLCCCCCYSPICFIL